jgi:hypothetical protein
MLKAIRQARGNITYHYGESKGLTFCLLRGHATRDPVVKQLIKTNGYVWQETIGMRRVMAYRRDGTSLPEIVQVLRKLQSLGCSVIPATTLAAGKQLPLDTRSQSSPKGLFDLFPIIPGTILSSDDLKNFLITHQYHEGDLPLNAGEYKFLGDSIYVHSFGTPARYISCLLNGDVVESLMQYRDETKRWHTITGCRIYGRGFQ